MSYSIALLNSGAFSLFRRKTLQYSSEEKRCSIHTGYIAHMSSYHLRYSIHYLVFISIHYIVFISIHYIVTLHRLHSL
jgi:hypothetical protein